MNFPLSLALFLYILLLFHSFPALFSTSLVFPLFRSSFLNFFSGSFFSVNQWDQSLKSMRFSLSSTGNIVLFYLFHCFLPLTISLYNREAFYALTVFIVSSLFISSFITSLSLFSCSVYRFRSILFLFYSLRFLFFLFAQFLFLSSFPRNISVFVTEFSGLFRGSFLFCFSMISFLFTLSLPFE